MKILFLLLMLAAAQAFGAMTLIKREMFVGTGQLTTNNLDQFDVVKGTFYCRYGGPSVLPETNGYSMDNMQATSTSYGQFGLPSVWTNYFIGGWFFIKTPFRVAASEVQLLGVVAFNYPVFNWCLTNGMLKAGLRASPTNSQTFPIPLNQWVWLGLAFTNSHYYSTDWDVRFYEMPLGGVLTNCLSLTGVSAYQRQQADSVRVYSDGGVNQTWNGRIGGVSLYSIISFTDVVYPSDLIQPVATPSAWYVNPATGNDTNTGAYPNQAWRTVQKINDASGNCGMFPATNYAIGDTLFIDTSAGVLNLTQTNLTFNTRGLNIMATNAPYWTNLIAVTLTNSSFTLIGLNTYAYSMGSYQPNITVWEDEKWMNHPQGATYLVVSNSLATNAGSFWTDGTNAYVHPFSDSNPLSDGKVYTRSCNYSAAIHLNAKDMNFRDCYAGKTAAIKATDNTDGLGAYVIGTDGGFGGNSMIAHCYLYYGGKHILGLVGGSANANVTVQDVQCEQCDIPSVSSSAWVLFMPGTPDETNNVYSFIRCRTDKPSGQIGSTSGAMNNQSVFLMHNSGSGIQFSSVTLDSCQMNGAVGWGICSNGIATNCIFGMIQPGATVSNIIVNSKFTHGGVSLFYSAGNTIVQNCIDVDTNVMLGNQWSRYLQGNGVTYQNNTFDFSGSLLSASGAHHGSFVSLGLTNFIFRNNIVVLKNFSGTNQLSAFENFTNNVGYSFSNNLYVLGSSNWLAANFTNGTRGTNLTFAQWQALGFDANSAVVDNPHLTSSYIPETGSAAIGKGLNLSNFSTTDYAGNPRPATGNWTIGAYQVASSTGGAGIITIFFLPAATGAGGTLKLAWLADYLGWILQSQTNSLNTGLSTNWVDVPGSSAITQTNITIDSAKPLMFFRLRSP